MWLCGPSVALPWQAYFPLASCRGDALCYLVVFSSAQEGFSFDYSLHIIALRSGAPCRHNNPQPGVYVKKHQSLDVGDLACLLIALVHDWKTMMMLILLNLGLVFFH